MQRKDSISLIQALSNALAQALSGATGKAWTSEVGPSEPVESDGTPLLLCLSLSGGLLGKAFLQIPRPDVLRLGSKILDEPASIFGDEHADALVKLVRSSEEHLNAALGNISSPIALQARQIEHLPSEARAAVQLRFRSDNDDEIVSSVYLDEELHRFRYSDSEPQVAAAIRAETQRPPENGQNSAAQQGASSLASALGSAHLDRVIDVPLNVTLRFGQRQLLLREVLELSTGALVELDRRVEESVDLMLDGRVIARGEVVIVDGNYGMRVTEVLKGSSAMA